MASPSTSTDNVLVDDDPVIEDAIVESDSEDEVFVPPPQELVDEYETLMSTVMPSYEPISRSATSTKEPTAPAPALPINAVEDKDDEDDTNPDGRPMTKAEKQNAKKKRRKERERALKAAVAAAAAAAEPKPVVIEKEIVQFRLFSSTPVKGISLSTVEDYPVVPNPRLVPLDPSLMARRRTVAEATAVNGEDLLAASASTSTTSPLASNASSNSALEEFTCTPQTARPLPPVFVAHELDIWGEDQGTRGAKCVAVPAVKMVKKSQGEDGEGETKRKRRRIRVVRERPPPRLWRPEVGLGGKSAGYAYGWGI